MERVKQGMGFLMLAVAVWRPQWNLICRTALAAGLACQALLHPVPAVSCGLVIAAIALWRAPEGGMLRESVRLTLMLAPAALVVLAGFMRILTPAFVLPGRATAVCRR